MKLIVGLGNPGRAYVNTRHNIGSAVVFSLAKKCGIVLKKNRLSRSLEGRALIAGKEAILAVPLTYMNLSGEALGSLIKKYRVKPHDLLVVSDDLDLELGRLKIKTGGSSSGHKGVKDIIEALGADKFNRLRIGIGRPRFKEETTDFVLSRFNRGEAKTADAVIAKAMACCAVWLESGCAKCMDKYNVRE